MPVILICQSCGNPFPVDPSRAKTALYCSNTCRGLGIRKPDVTALCAQCGTPFVVKRGARFCSDPCRRQSQSTIRNGIGLLTFWNSVQRCTHEEWCPYCCMPWLGGTYLEGYGEIQVAKKRTSTHRVAWALFHGRPIPNSLVVIAHYCHNRICCNPNHLHAGTQADNIEDSVRDSRHNHGETNGHSKFTDVTAMEALTLYAAGWPIADIARRFDVAYGTAAPLCRGETWKHLERP